MKAMQQGTARKKGGIAMTRRSITAVLVPLFAGFLSLVSTGVVSAREPAFAPQSASATIGAMHRVCTSPNELFMLCYQQQPDGTWTSEELQGDNTWTVVGTATADEVAAAIGDANADAVHVASVGPAVAVQGIDYRALEAPNFVPENGPMASYMEDATPPVGQNR
jgi:hypothetical protein